MAITAFLMLLPYFVWHTYHAGCYRYMPHVLVFLCFFAFLLSIFKVKNVLKDELLYVYLFIGTSFYLCLDYETKTVSLGGMALSFLVVVFLLMGEKEKIRVYKIYSWIFALSLLIGIIPYILTIMKVNLPYDIIVPDHVMKVAGGLYYKKIFGTVILNTPPMFRYSAMFDEPGVVGTISALFLVAERYNMRLKKNWILLIGGGLSFSTAFYAMSIIWILAVLIRKINYKRISILVIGVLIVIQSQYLHTPFEPLNRVLASTKVVDGNFLGNTRYTENFADVQQTFYDGDISHILFGKGRGWANSNPSLAGSWTYKFLLFDHGIVGFLLIISWLVAYVYHINRRYKCADVYILLFVFMLSIYQRPYVMNIQFLVILIGGALNSIVNQKTNDNINFNMI